MRVFKVTPARQPRCQPGITALEGSARYPLGHDTFRIDHGPDYFAFFHRLGELHYYAAESDSGETVAVGAGIVRRVPFRAGEKPRRTWYLCDLKVRPDFRGNRLPLRMLTRAFPHNYLRCPRGYAVTMNPAQSPNRVVRLLQHFRWARVSLATQLELYSLDAEAMRRHRALVERHRGPVSFLSLAGKKEIILTSTGKPMPLLHVQFGPTAETGAPEPLVGCVHMFCAPSEDPLACELRSLGVAPSATASVIHHGMAGADWRFILTSDI
jgi:hypothetical protein